MLVDFDMKVQQKIYFFIIGSIIMDYGLLFWPEVTVLS